MLPNECLFKERDSIEVIVPGYAKVNRFWLELLHCGFGPNLIRLNKSYMLAFMEFHIFKILR